MARTRPSEDRERVRDAWTRRRRATGSTSSTASPRRTSTRCGSGTSDSSSPGATARTRSCAGSSWTSRAVIGSSSSVWKPSARRARSDARGRLPVGRGGGASARSSSRSPRSPTSTRSTARRRRSRSASRPRRSSATPRRVVHRPRALEQDRPPRGPRPARRRGAHGRLRRRDRVPDGHEGRSDDLDPRSVAADRRRRGRSRYWLGVLVDVTDRRRVHELRHELASERAQNLGCPPRTMRRRSRCRPSPTTSGRRWPRSSGSRSRWRTGPTRCRPTRSATSRRGSWPTHGGSTGS